MPMNTTQRAQEVLYESEAALRLVDQELNQLQDVQGDYHRDDFGAIAGALTDLPMILERANTQIMAVLVRLRESRAAIQSTAVEKLQVTHEKLREVTSATEDAATNIMDACDRANGLVDQLDDIDGEALPDRARAGHVRHALRDELFVMMGALQFQDITSQQLGHASAVLVDMETRLLDVAKLFDINATNEGLLARFNAPHNHATCEHATCDPDRTTRNSEQRQALADEIFTAIKAPAA